MEAATIVRLPAKSNRIRGRFDSAQPGGTNEKHWLFADGLSASAAASSGVRRVLRNRSRYECENNSYAQGMIQSLANYVIGTGPRLQLNQDIETKFKAWAKEIKLAQKLRTMRMARAKDGEAFAVFIKNERLRSPVKFDLRLIEAEQVSTPTFFAQSRQHVDGIVFDEAGNPVAYHILKQHPGDACLTNSFDYETVDAKDVIHWFRSDRPGQTRGIPEIQASLSLFAQLRRYTLAVLDAAETAANLAALIYSDAPPDSDDAVEAEAFDTFDLERNTAMTLPMGWKATQLKAEQPTSTYSEFKKQIISEAGRCVSMPYNITAGDSSSYNYSSGRLDHQTFFSAVEIDRIDCEDVVLDPIFDRWLSEASLIEEFIGQEFRTIEPVAREWYWDQPVSIDPVKDATAKEIRLRSGQDTVEEICAEVGKDGKEFKEKLAKEVAEYKAAGLKHPSEATAAPQPFNDPNQPTDKGPDEDDEDTVLEDTPANRQRRGAA